MPNKKTISGSKILDGQDILAFRHDVLAGNFIATVELQKGKKAIGSPIEINLDKATMQAEIDALLTKIKENL